MGIKVRIDWSKYINKWSKYKDLVDFLNTKYMYSVLKYLDQEYKLHNIYPKKENVFKAFQLCDPSKLRVVIIGQDPYPNGQATGLAFANNEDTLSISPSLRHIRKAVELNSDKINLDFDVTLESWAKQGVLLLNTALTVQYGQPNSHKKVWDKFTKFIIKFIGENFPGTIFLLWGAEAQKYEVIDDFNLTSRCYVMKQSHPSFAERRNRIWVCDHFKRVNKLIETNNGKEFCIKW